MARFDTIAVYIMTDSRYGTLYLGVTSDLVHRISQHRCGEGSDFTRKYNCTKLVWYEVHANMASAIQRETSLKRYSRQWKIDLIEKTNPGWNDLWDKILPQPLPGQRISVEAFAKG